MSTDQQAARESNLARAYTEARDVGEQAAWVACYKRAARRGDWEQALEIATDGCAGHFGGTSAQLGWWRHRKAKALDERNREAGR